MNQTQSKALLKAAQDAIALLTPEVLTLTQTYASGVDLTIQQWQRLAAIRQLQAALETIQAPAATTAKPKAKRIPVAQYGPHHGDPCAKCGKAHRDHVPFPIRLEAPAMPIATFEQIRALITEDKAAKIREAQRERLSYCACGHSGERHEEDEMGNLLKCADCECAQFHYQVDKAA